MDGIRGGREELIITLNLIQNIAFFIAGIRTQTRFELLVLGLECAEYIVEVPTKVAPFIAALESSVNTVAVRKSQT